MKKKLFTLFNTLNENNPYVLLLIFIVTMIAICYPLFNRQMSVGHDMNYHLLRIQALKEGVFSRQFPVRIDPFFIKNFGYASSLFYPDLFLYFPAFLLALGFSIDVSNKLFLLVTIVVCFITTYYCGLGILKNKYPSIIIAVVFSLSQYHLQNIYARFALGEIQSYMFIPLIAYGLYDFIYENFEKPWLLIIGFCGLCYSHVLSLMIAGTISVVMSFFSLKRIIIDSKKIKTLVFSFVIFATCTCFFWAPFIEQIFSNTFKFQQIIPSNLSGISVKIPVMLANAYGIDGRSCSFGISILLLCILRIFINNSPEIKTQRRIIDWGLLCGFSILFVASEAFPWKYVPSIFGSIQFAWRLYAFASMFLSIAIGLMIDILCRRKFRIIGLAMLVLYMCGSAVIVISNSITSTTYITTKYLENTAFSIGNGEWLPVGVDSTEILRKEPVVLTDNGTSLSFSKTGIRTTIKSVPHCKYFDVPLIYYKGYTAVIKNGPEISSRLRISNEGQNKTIRVYCSEITESGTVIVDYTGTIIQKLSMGVSLLSLVMIGLLLFQRRNKYRRLSSG
ncbi:MAG: hypothetical protein NTZ74_05435 [Chloroflexi bacterium]|nr:hypothetical protein [Chloroflexota bacterium]